MKEVDDKFKRINKVSSEYEGWTKTTTTKAMEIKGAGCVVQVIVQQGDKIAIALTFVPDACILETINEEGKVGSRKLVRI